MDIHLVTSYNTPVSRRESFLFFSWFCPSRLQKLSIEDSYLLGESDFHTFLRGPDDVSVKWAYTLLDRRVLCYVCLFLCMWLFTQKGDWILKFSKLPPLSGDNPLLGGTFPMFSYPSDGGFKGGPCVPEALWMEARGFGEPFWQSFPVGLHGQESACNAGDPSSIPGPGRPPGKWNGNLLQDPTLTSRNQSPWLTPPPPTGFKSAPGMNLCVFPWFL